MRSILRTLLKIAACLYPLGIWLLGESSQLKVLGLGLFALLTLDLFTSLQGKRRYVVALLALSSACLTLLSSQPDTLVRLYPFLMSSSVLYLFVSSSRPEENPMIGPMGRHLRLEPSFLALLHRAKRLWIAGLSVNTAVLFTFLFAFSTETWALYAGLYSYLLLLVLFLGTLLYIGIARRRVS